MSRNGALFATTRNSERETRLAGCPSWIRIEPCALHRNPVFGGFWRTSGNCVLAENNPIPGSPPLKTVKFPNAMRVERVPFPPDCPGAYASDTFVGGI
jgi:hypothetical protein